MLFQSTSITDLIKMRRLQWAGNSWRTNKSNDRTKLMGKKTTEKTQNKIWEDLIKNDVKSLNRGLNWKEKLTDKEKWKG